MTDLELVRRRLPKKEAVRRIFGTLPPYPQLLVNVLGARTDWQSS